jgi:aspartyl-tRNA(Asn)/glutamyl-tRNA(Gln) amidotransferase subunit B
MTEKYEAVIGLEIHVQLLTKSKAYSGDSAEFGGMPNTHVSAITLAHPGTLPKHNKEAVNKAIKLGLALGCHIREENHYARKNYFYADLPKGYQITQDKTPICDGGIVEVKDAEGNFKNINLTRIHMEEDSGKSMHDQDIYHTLVDYNRAGVPLIEIVSEPELRSGEEAFSFVSEIRRLVRYLDICDGNMEEGSLRCDANVSIRPRGSKEFGTKVEVKNMNSISNVKRAIEHEVERQAKMIEEGVKIEMETRSFNALKGETFSMRTKELATDYRYFPEPDLPPLNITEDYISALRAEMPALPKELYKKFTNEFGLSDYDSNVLIDDKHIAQYFLNLTESTKNYKSAANWVMGSVKSYLNDKALHIEDFPLQAKQIAEIISLIDENKISHTSASQKLFPAYLESPTSTAENIANELNIMQSSDDDFIEGLAKSAMEKYPEKVEEYRAGKKSLLGLFMGEVMKNSRGKADPKAATAVLNKLLNE